MNIAFIGLGSNLGNSRSIFDSVLQDLKNDEHTHVCAVSSSYITKPLDNAQQPDYLNAVVELQTKYSPYALLKNLQRLESNYGRVRSGEHWASRTLDLDILLYNDLILQEPELTIPHSGMLERDFVLYPLFEISPDLEIPGFGPISKALELCENRGMTILGQPL